MAAAKTPPRQRRTAGRGRRMSMPYDPAATPAIVQPPAELAHLTGDALFEALTDPEAFRAATGREPAKWYSKRVWTEVGRSEGRFKVWMVNHYDVTKRGVDPDTIDDRIMVTPDSYDQRSPWWYETTARAWAIEEGLMARDGKFIPYKPSGRPKDRKDSVPRQRKATMRAGALEVLAECEKLTAGGATPAEAKAQLAEKHKMTTKQIARRLTTGREMRAAGIIPLTPTMPTTQRGEIITVMYRLLMADGRRKHGENARAEVAERLGCDRAEVDRAVDGAPPAVLAMPDPHVMTRGEAQDIVAALGGEITPEARAAAIVADLTGDRT